MNLPLFDFYGTCIYIRKNTMYMNPTVDGQNPANQFNMVNICNYPISSKGFSTIPGGKVWDVQGEIPPKSPGYHPTR